MMIILDAYISYNALKMYGNAEITACENI